MYWVDYIIFVRVSRLSAPGSILLRYFSRHFSSALWTLRTRLQHRNPFSPVTGNTGIARTCCVAASGASLSVIVPQSLRSAHHTLGLHHWHCGTRALVSPTEHGAWRWFRHGLGPQAQSRRNIQKPFSSKHPAKRSQLFVRPPHPLSKSVATKIGQSRSDRNDPAGAPTETRAWWGMRSGGEEAKIQYRPVIRSDLQLPQQTSSCRRYQHGKKIEHCYESHLPPSYIHPAAWCTAHRPHCAAVCILRYSIYFCSSTIWLQLQRMKGMRMLKASA